MHFSFGLLGRLGGGLVGFPNREVWQFHLSLVVAVVFLRGGLVGRRADVLGGTRVTLPGRVWAVGRLRVVYVLYVVRLPLHGVWLGVGDDAAPATLSESLLVQWRWPFGRRRVYDRGSRGPQVSLASPNNA